MARPGSLEISSHVMLCPWVEDRVRLVEGMKAQVPGLTVHEAGFPGEGPGENARRMWKAVVGNGATHHLFLVDDIVLAPRFMEHVAAIVEANPIDPVYLFCQGGKIPKIAEASASPYVYNLGALSQHAWVCPDELLELVVDFAERFPPGYKWDDTITCLAFLKSDIPAIITVPSLVQHALPSNSTVGNSNSQRVSSCFLDSERDVDWTRPILVPNIRSRTYGPYLKLCGLE